MRFPYPDLLTETHNGQRWYHTPAGAFPSITTVLGFTEAPEKKASLRRWQEALGPLAAIKSKQATDRGTMVHLLAERYLKKQQINLPVNGQPVSNADIQSFNALKLELDKIDEIWGQECALYSTELELAGRCDLVGIYRGQPVIIDFKTSGRVKGHQDINEYKCQLAFYGYAHNEMFGTTIEDGVILMVSELGFPQKFKIKLVDHMPELRKRAVVFWRAAVVAA